MIAADGAASRFAAQAGVRRDAAKPLGIAARRYYRIDHRPGPWLEVWMDLWDGSDILPGYGWLFPVPGGSINLGAGLLNTFTHFKGLSAERLAEHRGPLYALFETEFGVRMIRAEERVRATAATGADAQLLEVDEGTPLLSVERRSLTYGDKPVELRRSLYHTAHHHYRNELN